MWSCPIVQHLLSRVTPVVDKHATRHTTACYRWPKVAGLTSLDWTRRVYPDKQPMHNRILSRTLLWVHEGHISLNGCTRTTMWASTISASITVNAK